MRDGGTSSCFPRLASQSCTHCGRTRSVRLCPRGKSTTSGTGATTTGCWRASSRILGHATGQGSGLSLCGPQGRVWGWWGAESGLVLLTRYQGPFPGGGDDDTDCDHKGSLSVLTPSSQQPSRRVATVIPIIWRRQWVLREAK